MTELVIDKSHWINVKSVNLEELTSIEVEELFDKVHNFKIINDINRYEIASISSELSNFTIKLFEKNENQDNEITLQFDNVVNCIISNFDWKNIFKVHVSFTYSFATHVSLKYYKDFFGFMIWDVHDTVMPKLCFWQHKFLAVRNLIFRAPQFH